MLEKAKILGFVEGLQIRKNRIDVSYLQFADDTLLFCLANKEVLMNYRRLLDIFSLMSTLAINYAKSAIVSLNCNLAKEEEVSMELGCLNLKLPIIYLGIPLGANPKKAIV